MINNTTKSRGIPLRIEEVPEQLRAIFDYDSQMVEYSQTRKKMVTTIQRTCPKCSIRKRVPVVEIRAALRIKKLTGLCQSCFSKVSRPQPKGEASPGWHGGRRSTPKGYVMIRRPEHPNAQNGYVQEHRLVMENHIGRFLFPSETVHHKNGNKSDNRIENLELWSKSHSDGSRYEDLDANQIEQLISFLQELLERKKKL